MKIKNLASFESSPFQYDIAESFKFWWKHRRSEPEHMAGITTGEVFEMVKLEGFSLACKDDGEFIKVFRGFFNMTMGLSAAAERVLRYVMNEIKQNQDEVHIYVDKCQDFCNYKSKTDVYKGIFELCSRKIIAKKAGEDSVFFINVGLFFNGDRKRLSVFFDARKDFTSVNRPE